jgi:type IV pilus assembly protein PilA
MEEIAMLARIRKAQEKEGGFTLIELLVVMIIIGILAAIAIPVFLNQRKKAQDSAAKADVSTLGKEIATYYVDNTAAPTIDTTTTAGRYTLLDPSTTPATTQDLGKVSANVTLVGTHFTNSTSWCVEVTNGQGDKKTFHYSAANGLAPNSCVSGTDY